RSGALLTAGLASWVLGQFERANEEWSEAFRIAALVDAQRELCVAGFSLALGLLGFDLETSVRRASECIERSRALDLKFSQGIGSTVEGIAHAMSGNLDLAMTRY